MVCVFEQRVSIQPTCQAKFLSLLPDECNGLFFFLYSSVLIVCLRWAGFSVLPGGKKNISTLTTMNKIFSVWHLRLFSPGWDFSGENNLIWDTSCLDYDTSGTQVKAFFFFFPSYYHFHCLWLCPKHQKFSLVPFWGIYLSWNNVVDNFYNFERILAILTVPLTGCVLEMRSSFSWIIATTFLKGNQSHMFFWVCHACWSAALLNLWICDSCCCNVWQSI